MLKLYDERVHQTGRIRENVLVDILENVLGDMSKSMFGDILEYA